MRTVIAWFAFWAAFVAFAASGCAEEVKATFFVATNGNDGWSGKSATPKVGNTDGPFATLGRARDALRELKAKKSPKEPLTVMVRGGKYYLEETLRLEPEDSGSIEFPIVYQAYPGEKPTLSGGRIIKGWKPYKDTIQQAEVPETKGGRWRFRQLFLDGQRQIRARYPNFVPSNPLYGGWAVPEGMGRPDTFKYKSGTFKQWAKPQEAEIFLVDNSGLSDTVPVQSVNHNNAVIKLVDRIQDWSGMPYMDFKPPFHLTIGRGFHFYVENLLEELDQPGEWCLDSEEGIVYFWPPTGSVEGKLVVVAPKLESLIDISGAAYITISGFTFTETTTGDVMHRGGQEGYGAMLPKLGRKYAGEALHMQGAEHCRIRDNLFYAVGGNGIYMEGYNTRNLIQGNEISYAGFIGICLIGSHYENPKVPKRYPIYNEVLDNYIHHCGVFNKYVAGIFLGLSESNVVGHNRIEYMPHHAINLGNSGFGRDVLEYNEIRHAGLQSCDKGAINSWMEDPYGHVERHARRSGNVIRYNWISDFEGRCLKEGVLTDSWTSWGLYLDNYTSNCFVYGNIIVRTGGVGIMMNGGQNNFVENNIIINPSVSATHFGGWWQPQMEGFMMGNHFSRNIVYHTEDVPKVVHRHMAYDNEPITDVIGVSDFNVFFSPRRDFTVRESSGAMTPMEESKRPFPVWPNYKDIALTEWQKLGFDTHSVFADPLFVDPQHDDYRLKPESPALKLGFQPIDTSQIGPRDRFKRKEK